MRRQVEQLEKRDLLAGDIQLVYDISDPDAQGEVTAHIRVFADSAGEVLVESSLTDELENPMWELTQGFSNRTMDLSFLPATPDFRIGESELMQIVGDQNSREIGDLNGDGIDDFFVSGERIRVNREGVAGYVLYGDADLENENVSPEEMIADGKGVALTLLSPFDWFPKAPEAIGDLNHDGFDDFILDPYIIFGGPTLTEQTNIELHNLDPTFGFFLRAGAVGLYGEVEVGGIGDVNGDGLDDVLFSYEDVEDCLCTATDRDNSDSTGGGLVLYGGTTVGSSGVFDPETDPHTALKITTVRSSGLTKAELHDINGDGLLDVHLSAEFREDGRKHIVIVGREGGIPSLDFGHAFDNFDEMLDGETTFAFQVPASSRRGTRSLEYQYLDVNSDGIADALTSKTSSSEIDVFLGERPTPLSQGEGDIRETIHLEPTTSAVFTVRGTQKENAEPVTTIAVPVDQTGDDLTNNISSAKDGVALSVDLEVSEFSSVGESIEATLRIANSGPSDAIAARLTDSLFGLSDLTWTQTELPFPVELDLREMNGTFGASMPAPERVRFNDRLPRSFLNKEPLHTNLGNALGALDLNGDGFDDLFVHVEGTQFPPERSGLVVLAERRGARYLVFEGGPNFGDDGQFPDPVVEEPDSAANVTEGDFNGDGLPEQITVNASGDTVEVRFGNEDSTGDPTELDGRNGFSIGLDETDVSSVAFGDLNGDGLDDLIIGDQSRSEILNMIDVGLGPRQNPRFFDSQRTVHVVYGTRNLPSSNAFALEDIDGRNGFRMILQGFAPGSRTEVLSNFDVNGDGVDDLLISDPNAGAFLLEDDFPGAAYVVFGRTATTVAGEGPLDLTLDIKAGSKIEYFIRATATAPLSGSIGIEAASDQIELFPESNTVSLGEASSADKTSDLNGDGAVNFADFLVLSANFGAEVASREEGDVNGDGIVNFGDFLILSDEFGQ